MKYILNALLALGFLGFSPVASATTWGASRAYFVRYHFDGTAFGKKVAGVYVHTGVLRQRSSCTGQTGSYWDQVQHLKMQPTHGHFFAKAMITASTGECQPSLDDVIVQYWVYFVDGTNLLTQPARVQSAVYRVSTETEYNRARQQLANDFHRWEDATSTYGTVYEFGWAD